MTCIEWSVLMAFAAALAASVSAVVAAITLIRTIAWQVPIVEFLCEYDETDETAQRRYKLTVSNPTRRLLVLDYVDVLSPDAKQVKLRPNELDVRGDVERAWDQPNFHWKRRKPVFLPVKPGESADLHIDFGTQEEDFEVEFKLYWSKRLGRIERWCITNDLKLDPDEMKSRRLAAIRRSRVSDKSL